MARTPAPVLGSAYESRSLLLAAQEMINLYVETVSTQDGKMPGALYNTPGLKFQAQAPITAPVRALYVMGNGFFYGVVGNVVYSISRDYEFTVAGYIGTNRGPVSIVDNGLQLLIVDRVNAYGYDTVSLTFGIITLPFTAGAPVICAYQDGFFLLSQGGTQQWWASALNDVFTWNGLSFSSADGQPDPIVTMADNHREVWLFGSMSVEVWINTGSPGFAFARLQGVFIQEGCAAPYSVQVAGQSVIWLSRSRNGEGIVFRSHGYQAERVSTHAIEREIQGYEIIEDAISYVYEQEGHQFYVLCFPNADVTWVLDLSLGLWHRRADFVDGCFHRHRSNCHALFNGLHIVGDYANGKLYSFDLNEFQDDGRMRKWLRAFQAQPTSRIDLRRNKHVRLELYMENGGRLDCGPDIRVLESSDDDWRNLESAEEDDVRVISGAPDVNCQKPMVMMRFSDSGGRKWSNEFWRPVGEIGEVTHRVIWNRLGISRDRIYEISATDPFKVAIVGAFLDTTPGAN